ncbi:nucleotide pyrophosphohydrolase [Chryseomicrobium palamuruense]|uniref:Nucleotide pyrophosphohydrolase n=1 Tax=Chryseomicrobium palamuruense TaxID=682973 RepID=A0ABV8UTJ5_9BACL
MQQKTIRDMQGQVDTYISQFKEGYFPPMELLARLTEELGELSREIQHQYGMKKKKSTEVEKAIEEELGDFLFVLICLANSEKIDMQNALDRVMEKYSSRDRDRWTKKEEN